MSKNNEIRSAGLKVTHARKRILEVLETSRKSHLSADDINKILIKNNDEVGVATVYRVLNQFVDAGKHFAAAANCLGARDTGAAPAGAVVFLCRVLV